MIPSQESNGNGVKGDPLLDTTSGDKEALNPRTKVLCLRQVFPKGLNGTEKELLFVTSNNVIQRWDGELLKKRYRRILCFGYEVRKE